MEKEAIFSGLKEQLGSTQLSDRTLSDYAGAIESEFSDDNVVTDELWAKHVRILQSVNGNLHNDVAKEVAKWRDNQPAKPEPVQHVEEPNEGAEAPAWFKSFKDEIDKRFEGLDADREKEKAERSAAEFRKSVVSSFREKFASNGMEIHEYQLGNAVKEVQIDPSKNVAECVEELEKAYNSHLKASGISDYGFPRSGTGGGKRGSTPQDDFFRRKAAKEGWLKESNN